MPDKEEIQEKRLTKAENNIEDLYGKVNKLNLSTAVASEKLNSVLVALGELKESVASIKNRPLKATEKFLFSILGALGTGVGAALIALVIH